MLTSRLERDVTTSAKPVKETTCFRRSPSTRTDPGLLGLLGDRSERVIGAVCEPSWTWKLVVEGTGENGVSAAGLGFGGGVTNTCEDCSVALLLKNEVVD